MNVVARAWRRVDTFVYPARGAAELGYLRALVGAYSVVYLAFWSRSFSAVGKLAPEEWRPVGVLAGLASPLPAGLLPVALVFTLVSGVAFTVGFRYRWTGPLHALLVLLLTTYKSSWGMTFHTDNLMTLHLAALALAPAADDVSLDARTPSANGAALTAGEHGRYGWALRTVSVVTVLTYFVAGVAKLRASGFAWASGHVLLTQVAFDNVRKIELGSTHSPLGALMVLHPAAFAPLAALALAVELGAPIALVGGRVGRAWALAAWSFHLGVALVMAIVFAYPLSFVAFASFFRPDTWPVLGFVRRLSGRALP